MKILLVLLLGLVTCPVHAQSVAPKPLTGEQVARQGQALNAQLASGYQTPIDAWVIHQGDTLQLGRGARPDKTFVHAYARPQGTKGRAKAGLLAAGYSGKEVIVDELTIAPNQAGESILYGLFAAGGQSYQLAIEPAIKAGELLPPVRYRPSAQASPALPVVAARELARLKAQLAAGTISEAEFEAQKKKLLDH
ncbi:SHOCT domain-containing protein [Fibrella forsythiae]|uniref:SHOCT domain-containing protein n=1 Tax=Fibrella forsythiae TaxID=2817061 RepID=A0ABS3JSM8_9BACT|nr:SHOCT domain-containing protein [Fibrella forsythiae]MBO0953017.1 SHOCT domain-containing protein [Fibrella forsythiae]